MTPAALALPSGLFRLQCHLKYLLLPSSIPTIKAFSSSMVLDTEETPAMKALKDIPYPSASPDRSIFESRSGEYDRVRLPAVLARRVASSRKADQRYQWYASRVLERLARSDKFEEAEQVRQDLAEMNVPIRLSGVYLRVAWHVLRQRPWPPNRTEIFTNWLSLLPSVSSDKIPLRFALLKSALLFNSQHLDLKTIAQFGIVLSSKGYIRGVSAPVVACLTRYADPNASSRVLDEILAANDDYIRSKLGTVRTRLVRTAKNTTKRLWGIAIRTHCTAGRPELAFQMAKRADERNIRLTTFTYKYLLGKLDANGLDDLAAEIRAHPCCGSLDVTKSRPTVDDSIPTSIPPISREQSMMVNQAIALAILERCSRSGLPAHAVDIVPYFDIYKTHLRGGRDANMLRSRAYRISLTALSTVLLAELLHHLRRGQFIHVLWVFEKYFQMVGVPSEDITRRLWTREHYPPDMQIPPRYIPLRIKKTTFNIPYKLWPTSYHTALVWSALVHLCESEEEVFALYDSLLQHSAQFQKTTVSHQHLHHPPSHDSSSSTLEFVLGTADKFDAAHFRPFLIPFTHLRDAKYSLRVLDDMQDHGIAPSAQFLSTAAALQARFGDPALALRILDVVRGQIELQGDEGADVDVEIEMGAESEVRERDKKQQQLRVAYTSVLRGFIDRRDIVRARQVAELLHGHLGYVEGRGCSGGNTGGNARTDVALRFLRRLEVEGPRISLTDSEADADYFYPFLKKPDYELIKTLNASPGAKRGRL